MIKISDFGLARAALEWVGPSRSLQPTKRRYLAPERGEPLGPEADVFAIGVLLEELLPSDDQEEPTHYRQSAVPEAHQWPALFEVARKAQLDEPAHRYPNAGALLSALSRESPKDDQKAAALLVREVAALLPSFMTSEQAGP
jgi:serine/threonine protein kinase